jgi:hypothetical protein
VLVAEKAALVDGMEVYSQLGRAVLHSVVRRASAQGRLVEASAVDVAMGTLQGVAAATAAS